MTDTANWMQEALARCEAATRPRWVSQGIHIFSPDAKAMICELSEPYYSQYVQHVELRLGSDDAAEAYANGDFIAHARTDLPRALCLLAEAAEALEAVEWVGDEYNYCPWCRSFLEIHKVTCQRQRILARILEGSDG